MDESYRLHLRAALLFSSLLLRFTPSLPLLSIHLFVLPPPPQSPLQRSSAPPPPPTRPRSPDRSLSSPLSSGSRLMILIALPRVPSSKPLAGSADYPSMHRARLLADALPARKSLKENWVEAFSLELFDEVTASESK